MAYKDFNEKKYVYVTDTSTVNKLGSIQVDEPIEIANIRLDFYKNGTEVGDEVFRLNIYSDPDYSKVYASSNDVALSDIPDLGTYWIGWLRFDFDSIPVVGTSSNTFYIGLEPVTYTRVGDTFYVGAAADWYPNINDIGVSVGAYLEIYERDTSDVCG